VTWTPVALTGALLSGLKIFNSPFEMRHLTDALYNRVNLGLWADPELTNQRPRVGFVGSDQNTNLENVGR